MSLDINDISIGFSKRGVASYADALIDGVNNKVAGVVSSGAAALTKTLESGWQGAACEAFIKKLDESQEKLKDILRDMGEAFEAAVKTQADQYSEEDTEMSGTIEGQSIL